MISNCDEFLYWVDKYFSKAGLEYLLDAIDPLRVREIKILTSVKIADEKFRNLFKEFAKSMDSRGVKAELRVITDHKLDASIHDRWLLSKNKNFNIPSPDIVARGQYSEIKETTGKPPFAEWWRNSKDVIKDWETIRKLAES
jgi:hypothetical protein